MYALQNGMTFSFIIIRMLYIITSYRNIIGQSTNHCNSMTRTRRQIMLLQMLPLRMSILMYPDLPKSHVHEWPHWQCDSFPVRQKFLLVMWWRICCGICILSLEVKILSPSIFSSSVNSVNSIATSVTRKLPWQPTSQRRVHSRCTN